MKETGNGFEIYPLFFYYVYVVDQRSVKLASLLYTYLCLFIQILSPAIYALISTMLYVKVWKAKKIDISSNMFFFCFFKWDPRHSSVRVDMFSLGKCYDKKEYVYTLAICMEAKAKKRIKKKMYIKLARAVKVLWKEETDKYAQPE